MDHEIMALTAQITTVFKLISGYTASGKIRSALVLETASRIN